MTGPVEMSRKELVQWMRHAMTDAGFCARELMGYDYDIDFRTQHRINVGTGGLRDQDPYRKMIRTIQGLDSDSKQVVVLAPRGGLKSSGMAADAVRFIFEDPNRGMLLMSGTDSQVLDKSKTIRNVFEFNKHIHRAWDIDPAKARKRGERRIQGTPWRLTEWELGVRTIQRDIPTFKTGTLRKPPTGGHYDLIHVDDLIDWRNVRKPEQIELSKTVMKLIEPLTTPGARIVVAGTLYNPLDLYTWLMQREGWEILLMDCGFSIVEIGQGKWRLEGEPAFPNLTKEYLQFKLNTMDPVDFTAQYMNRYMSNITQKFRREWFKAVHWEGWMKDELTIWILADTATSKKESACLTAMLVVGIDRERRKFLLDASIGRFEGGEIIDRLFSFYDVWGKRGTMGGITMEETGVNQMLGGFLEQEQRKRQIRLNIRTIRRSANERGKKGRISDMEPTFRAGDVHVVIDTFPKTFVKDNKEVVLFDPTGYKSPDNGQLLPSGELVDQFILHPNTPPEKRDIADSFADIEQKYRNGEQLCYWVKPRPMFARLPGARRAMALAHRPTAGNDFLQRLGRAPD